MAGFIAAYIAWVVLLLPYMEYIVYWKEGRGCYSIYVTYICNGETYIKHRKNGQFGH